MDATSIRLPFSDGSQSDVVISRLRRMRQRSAARDEAAISNFLERSRVVRSRMDWWRGKMRWFVGGDSAAKIKANMQVEQSLGKEHPDLWHVDSDQAASGGYIMEAPNSRETLKNSAEFEVLKNSGSYSIDPLMQAEIEYMEKTRNDRNSSEFKRIAAAAAGDVLPGGYDPAELRALFPEEEPKEPLQLPDTKKPSMRKLRLLEIHNCERDIEELANEVIGDIKSAVAEKEVVKPQLKLVANGQPIIEEPQLEVVQPKEDSTSVVPASTEVAIIWG